MHDIRIKMMKDILKIIALHDDGLGWYGIERALILLDHPISKEGTLMFLLKELEQNGFIESKQVPESLHPKYLIQSKGKELLDSQD